MSVRPRVLVCDAEAQSRRAASRAARRRQGQQVHLTPIEFKLLRALVHHRGRLLAHSALLQQVWGVAYEADRQTLRTHIANLRGKLEPTDGLP